MMLSVIIPVYKVENTLERCVRSVLLQNISDMEVILVDDGSPDNCPALCDNLARRDSRIRVVHKANGGLSDARNAGIEIATGIYITFVDSDDYLHDNTYAPLFCILERNPQIDILEFMVQHDNQSCVITSFSHAIYTHTRDYWTETKAWSHAYAWNKIYRRTLFTDVRFAKGRLFEDLLLLPDVLQKARSVATTPLGWYNYSDNDDGISKQVNLPTLLQLLVAEVKAAIKMKTMPWDRNGRNLYYLICCRCYDIVRLTLGKRK